MQAQNLGLFLQTFRKSIGFGLSALPALAFSQEGKVPNAVKAAAQESERIFMIVASVILIIGIPLAALLMRKARSKTSN